MMGAETMAVVVTKAVNDGWFPVTEYHAELYSHAMRVWDNGHT